MKMLVLLLLLLLAKQAVAIEVVIDEEIQNAVEQIASPALRFADAKHIKFHLLDSDEIGVFSIGRDIFVNLGTFLASENSDVLYYLIAHELSHIACKHRQKTKLPEIENRPLWIENGKKIYDFPARSFNKKQETEAISKSMEMLEKTNRDLTAMKALMFYFSNSGKIENQYTNIHPISQSILQLVNESYYYMLDPNNKLRPGDTEIFYIKVRLKIKGYLRKKSTLVSDSSASYMDGRYISYINIFRKYQKMFEFMGNKNYQRAFELAEDLKKEKFKDKYLIQTIEFLKTRIEET